MLENIIYKNKEKLSLSRGLEYVSSISGLHMFIDLKILYEHLIFLDTSISLLHSTRIL